MQHSKVVRISYLFIFLTIIVAGWLKLATPFIAILFASLVLNLFKFWSRRWVAVMFFLVIVGLIFYGSVMFVKEAVHALPQIAEESLPIINRYALEYGMDTGISDVTEFKATVAAELKEELRGVAKFAEIATKEFVYLIISLVVAVSIFLSRKLELDEERHAIRNNLYSELAREISTRFITFYQSFVTVMGAQVLISSINTIFTGIFLLSVGLPYATLTIFFTFLCGLIPIVGNIISNTLIVCIALTVSPQLAIAALLFLVGLHKLEYFLNGKIIGGRIRNPMWLTLLSLVVGERLLGIAGMILAPVVLFYVKVECAKIEIEKT